MEKKDIIDMAAAFVENSPDNIISTTVALSDAMAGMKIFEPPIFAFAASDDEKFKLLQDQSVIGNHFLLPREWLPQAKTVCSFFLPFTTVIKQGNRKDMSWPSEEWLHGRIEGQAFINLLCKHLQSELIKAGYKSVVPCLDERFRAQTAPDAAKSENQTESGVFTSNWSERHVAFVCGLGTFGRSNFLDRTAEKHKPRYGCGKCQIKVPCESGIPKRIKN